MGLSVLEYKKICTELCDEITYSQLEMLKNHFLTQINSKRVLSRIDTARSLFKILEKRDILSHEYEDTLNEIRWLVKPNTIKSPIPIHIPINNRLHPTQEYRGNFSLMLFIENWY